MTYKVRALACPRMHMARSQAASLRRLAFTLPKWKGTREGILASLSVDQRSNMTRMGRPNLRSTAIVTEVCFAKPRSYNGTEVGADFRENSTRYCLTNSVLPHFFFIDIATMRVGAGEKRSRFRRCAGASHAAFLAPAAGTR